MGAGASARDEWAREPRPERAFARLPLAGPRDAEEGPVGADGVGTVSKVRGGPVNEVGFHRTKTPRGVTSKLLSVPRRGEQGGIASRLAPDRASLLFCTS